MFKALQSISIYAYSHRMLLNRHSLIAFREVQGLTVTELAHRSEISQGYLSNIEAGRKIPPGAVIERLATALGVSHLAITHYSVANSTQVVNAA